MDYPERPTNRPDPIIEGGHKAPDERKRRVSRTLILLAVIALLALAAFAAITAYRAERTPESGSVQSSTP
jgi:multisubunit Na+/H+ antiporter MnhC subunit